MWSQRNAINLALIATVVLGASVAEAKQPRGGFSRFRPVENRDQFAHIKNFESKTTIEEIYTPDRIREMETKYKSTVAPAESIVNSPYHHARPYEVERYNAQNQELANWTAKQALNTKLKELLSGADKDSAPLKVMGAVNSLSNIGNDDSAKKTEAKNAPAPKNSKAPPPKLVASAKSAAAEEEKIPTTLKTKMNLLQGRGQVRFTNPVATTSLNLDVRQKVNERNAMVASDRVSVDVDKNFKDLSLISNVKYGLERKVMQVNLSKKITNEISANVSSQRFTGEQRDSSGSKSQEAVQMLYSISF